MPAVQSLRDLLVEELRDLHHAENQWLKALPKMAKAATHAELRDGFNLHAEQTREHIDRLDRCFQILGANAKGRLSPAMKGLVEETRGAINEDEPGSVRDARLIGAAQCVEHYEIAAYGTARTFAQTVGETKVAEILQESLNEEGETDRRLTAIASRINLEACAGGCDEE